MIKIKYILLFLILPSVVILSCNDDILTGPTPPTTEAEMKLIAPANNAVGESVTTIFRWNKLVSSQNYNLFIATDSLLGNLVRMYSFQTDTSGVLDIILDYNKMYYWRIVSHTDGVPDIVSQIWKFKTKNIINLISPSPDELVNILNTKLKWNCEIKNASFRIYLAEDSLLSVNSVSFMTNDTLLNLENLSAAQKYYWRVDVMENNVLKGQSSISSFKTKGGIEFEMLKPFHNSLNNYESIVLVWRCSQKQSNFTISIAEDSMFTVLTKIYETKDTTLHLDNLMSSTNYYWKVSVSGPDGKNHESQIRMFRTSSNNEIQIMYPEDGSVNVPCNFYLRWETALNISYYDMYIGTQSPLQQKDIICVTYLKTHRIENLQSGTKYYCKIRGRGNVYASETISFTTTNSSNAVYLLEPWDKAVLNAGLHVLRFQMRFSGTFLSSYLYIAEDSLFKNITHSSFNINPSEAYVDYGKIYYLKAGITLTSGENVESPIYSIRVKSKSETDFNLSTPSEGSQNNGVYPIYQFNELYKSTGYRLLVATDDKFRNIVSSKNIKIGTYTTNYVTDSIGLVPGKQYFSKIVCYFPEGDTVSTPTRMFYTKKLSDYKINLESPINGATDILSKPSFSWDRFDGEKSFNLYISKDMINWSKTDINNINSYSDWRCWYAQPLNIGLDMGTKYFWKVVAYIHTGDSVVSDVWSFSTRSGNILNLVSPKNQSQDGIRFPIFEWENIENTDSYALYISKIRNNFANPISTISNYKYYMRYYTETPLEKNTEYFWKVKANMKSGDTLTSPVWSFKTMDSFFWIGQDAICSFRCLQLNNSSGIAKYDTIFNSMSVGSSVIYRMKYDELTNRYYGTSTLPDGGTTIRVGDFDFSPDCNILEKSTFGYSYSPTHPSMGTSGLSFVSSNLKFEKETETAFIYRVYGEEAKNCFDTYVTSYQRPGEYPVVLTYTKDNTVWDKDSYILIEFKK